MTMLNPPIISIVDDDESVREAMADLMSSIGFIVEAFSSAEAFLASNSSSRASCLIADVQMPGISGVALKERLSAEGRFIPTILVTAYPDDRVRAQAAKAGVVAYLTKPFTDSDLLKWIDVALQYRKAS